MVQTRRKDDSSFSTTKHLRSTVRASRARIELTDNDDEDYEANVSISLLRGRRPRRHCTTISGMSRASRTHLTNTSDSDAEMASASDESMFQTRRKHIRRAESSRHIGMRSLHSSSIECPGTSKNHRGVVSMEESLPHQEEDGVRRSTRTRKPTVDALSASWIMGTTQLLGYPSYKGKNTSATEEIDKHESRRSRFCQRGSSIKKQTTKSRSSQPVLDTRQSVVKQEVEDEIEQGDEKEETGKNTEDEETAQKINEEDHPQANGTATTSDDGSHPEERSNDEGRSKLKTSRTRGRSSTECDRLKMDDGFPDMYSRVKRTRRPVTRFAFSPGRRMVNQNHTSSDSDESEDSDSDRNQQSTRSNTRKYQLRAHKPAVDRFQAQHEPVRRPQRSFQKVLHDSVLRRLGHRPTSKYTQDSSSSSSDSDARFDHKKPRSRHVPHNYHSKDGAKFAGHHSKDGKASTLADIDPMALDTSIRFDHVGGLENHIRCLQEMVVFPLLYKDIFEKFNITPPKGVLFHGPPGTGKTLIARALANECSQGDRKVTFFMRKGADCLSKWVGESERQLRLLFEQAFQKKPSIIFFDEIDGLAPVRSSKQDQIHASIVATLLALMDGLDSRGEVIVIGATNRLDAIDPALRRPGRFDRELYFPLPACKERQEILRIHVSKWDKKPKPELISELAEQSSGYCGSDLRALCAESVIHALRRTYPQIYKSSQKLLLDTQKVQVESVDFAHASASIIPASHRVAPSPARKLRSLLEPLLSSTLDTVIKQLSEIFPHCVPQQVDVRVSVHRPKLLLLGSSPHQAQTVHLAPALLHRLEHIPVHILDLGTLYEVSARSPEETVSQVFQEARRNPPSIIYMPGLGQWWDLVPKTVQAVFLMQLEKLDMASPVFLLATSDASYEKIAPDIRNLFSRYRDEVFAMSNPTESEREAFFHPLLLVKAIAEPDPPKLTEDCWEELPLAPPPEPAKLTEDELQTLYEKEEHTLRELRIFLREVCAKLARNRMFFLFTKPVDILEVPDYLDIIEQPMDLETMMTKIDQHHYVCAREFLNDIDLICRNALEYNPARDQADKLIRHRACFLRDTAYALIKAEMDSDFEDRCRAISKDRKNRKDSPSRFVPAPHDFMLTEPIVNDQGSQVNCEKDHVDKDTAAQVVNGDLSSHSSMASNNGPVSNGVLSSSARKRRFTGWSRGFIPKSKKKKKSLNETDSPSAKQASMDKTDITDLSCTIDLKSTCSSPTSPAKTHSEGEEGQTVGHSQPPTPSNGVQSISLSDSGGKSPRGRRLSSKMDSSEEHFDSSGCQSKLVDISSKDDCELRTVSFDSNCHDEITPAHVPDTLNEVVIDQLDLERLLMQVVTATKNCTVDRLLELYVRFEKHILRHQTQWNRSKLPEILREELQQFEQHHHIKK